MSLWRMDCAVVACVFQLTLHRKQQHSRADLHANYIAEVLHTQTADSSFAAASCSKVRQSLRADEQQIRGRTKSGIVNARVGQEGLGLAATDC